MLESFRLENMQFLSNEQLEMLAQEVRKFMIEEVSKTGGHLGASLGVVELTIALHHVFNSPKDHLIWDIGHQSYAHKILTGRQDQFNTIRSYKGLSGFTNPDESSHDHFFAGHSSTSISLGIGVASAKILQSDPSYTISIIGDGAISAGMAFEAMNNVETAGKKFITILNDNDMSISPPTGAISKYLPKLFMSHGYQEIKSLTKGILSKFPNKIFELCKNINHSMKGFMVGDNFFEELGYDYIGPIDGHNIRDLTKILNIIKENAIKPVLLHVITKKGKGYEPAENAVDKFHGVKPFDIKTGNQAKSSSVSCSKFVTDAIAELAKKDGKITAITPAMKQGSALEVFAKMFPDRFYDVGIAEQHAVTFSAGQAKLGMKPFCFLYSTFLQRAYDQIIHDVALQKLPVRFVIDRSGLTGEDGPTHHGVFDIAALRVIPNVEICNTICENSINAALEYSKTIDKPLFIRIPKENIASLGLQYVPKKLTVARNGTDGLLITSGRLLKIVLQSERYQNWTIIDPFFFKPIDENILNFIKEAKQTIILDENSIGGMSSIILELCHDKQISTEGIAIHTLPDRFITHGSMDELLNECLEVKFA